jgi:hypothetical protein
MKHSPRYMKRLDVKDNSASIWKSQIPEAKYPEKAESPQECLSLDPDVGILDNFYTISINFSSLMKIKTHGTVPMRLCSII